MADDADGSGFSILKDLQLHLRTAHFPVENLSTLAREGDERVKYYCFYCAKEFTLPVEWF